MEKCASRGMPGDFISISIVIKLSLQRCSVTYISNCTDVHYIIVPCHLTIVVDTAAHCVVCQRKNVADKIYGDVSG